ncbi:hypothetical protein C9374_012386 [Naegleria lovaniensis]|uniref:Guanylate cyclase domain-containing protein n=1 Tax=Naegleria lovaniensis TaxID=51637 RepID=A0AA88H1U7_NAELO|nr:uncharacterized protein C9374_012386 [Naegleria lovaniensis]KAG2392134.1 hypothetical protein C9374_012386 [Naegleria lovaniensis]
MTARTKIHPQETTTQKDQDAYENSPYNTLTSSHSLSSSNVSTNSNLSFFRSIKCCLILLISSLILLSVVVLSATWLSSFAPTVFRLSSSERDGEFKSIIHYAEQTLREVAIANEAVKQQLVGDRFSMYDYENSERKMYSAYKSGLRYQDGITISGYVGDPLNYCFGVILWTDTMPATFNITPDIQTVYYCHNSSYYDYCHRSSTPDETMATYDLSVIIDTCEKHPNEQAYTLSYGSIAMPQYVFITILNCVVDRNQLLPSHNFSYYYAVDLTVDTISSFLKSRTKSIPNSKGFIVETETEFLIAVDSEVVITEYAADGSLNRKTTETVDDAGIQSIGKIILSSYQNNWKQIPCNSMIVLTSSSMYIMVERMCTKNYIDWIVVLAMPQWNYIGSTIIAIIASIFGSILIVTFGIILGVFVSLKIVKPFEHLIQLFESVAQMDLDKIQLNERGAFSEVKQLQQHFMNMVQRMKLYRSFIPAHLLSEIENSQNGINNEDDQGNFQKSEKDSEKGHSSKRRFSESEKSDGASSSSRSMESSSYHRVASKKNTSNVNKFSLYMEHRRVTLLEIHLDGLNEWIHIISPNETVMLLSDVFDQVNSISRASGGHISSIENDSIIIAFNASSNQSNHEEKASQVARQLHDKLLSVKYMKWKNHELVKKKPQLYDNMTFRFAILCQECFCGNIGSNDFKNFTIMSSSKSNLASLMEVSKRLEIPIVCCEKVNAACSKSFQTRFVDTKNCVDDTYIMSVTLNHEVPPQHTTKVYELGGSLTVSQDEWMYELADQQKKNKWNSYNQACQLYFEKEYPRALELFQEFYQSNTNDKPAEHMIRLCEQLH